MAPNDELVMRTLLEIKEDIGGLSSDVKGIKDSLVKNESDHEAAQGQIRRMESVVSLIPGHLQAVKDMESRMDDRIGKIEADVKSIKDTDIPAIKDQLVVGKWLSTKRNKFFALIGIGLLGAAGNAAAGLIKDSVKVTIVHPPVTTTHNHIATLPKSATPSADPTDFDTTP